MTLDAMDPADFSDPDEIVRRQPVSFTPNSTEVLAAAGIGDPTIYRQQRAQAVLAELAAENDAARRTALQARLDELAAGGIRRNSLGFQLNYGFVIRGPNTITDQNGVLALPHTPLIWRAAFWMGGWDADGLCGYVQGALTLE